MNPLLTKKEVAARLQITPRTVDRLRTRGQLGHIKIGRVIRFRESDIDDYLHRHQTYRPVSDTIVTGPALTQGLVALVPATDDPVVLRFFCENSDCPARDVDVAGRLSPDAACRCPLCGQQLRFIEALGELLLAPVTAEEEE